MAYPGSSSRRTQLEGPAPAATGVAPDLAATINACLAFDPAERPSLDELAAMLTPVAPGARPWPV